MPLFFAFVSLISLTTKNIKHSFLPITAETSCAYFISQQYANLKHFKETVSLKKEDDSNAAQKHMVKPNKIYKTQCNQHNNTDLNRHSDYKPNISEDSQLLKRFIKCRSGVKFTGTTNSLNDNLRYIDAHLKKRTGFNTKKEIEKKTICSQIIDIEIRYNKIKIQPEYEDRTCFIVIFANDKQVLFYKKLLLYNEIVNCV